MGASINVRLFSAGDAAQVRNLFIRVTRLLVPPHMTEVFEGYIARSLREEVDRIVDYYGDKGGAFWVAIDAALTLYRNSGYELVREELSVAESNATVGAGLRRFYFEKTL